MSQRISPSTGAPYRLARACRVWRLPLCGVYRRQAPRPETTQSRPGPVGAMPDAALLQAIRDVLASSPFHGEGYRKVELSQGLGAAAPCRHPHRPAAGAATGARGRPARAVAPRRATRTAQS